jgi:hypothetical protein
MTLVLSKFGAGDGEGRLGSRCRGATEAHALERPLDGPSGADEACKKFRLRIDSIE